MKLTLFKVLFLALFFQQTLTRAIEEVNEEVNEVSLNKRALPKTWKCNQHKLCSKAKSHVGSDKWSYKKERTAAKNKNVKFGKNEYKSNLFVYEMLLDIGIDIGTPNSSGLIFKSPRPPTTTEWKNYKGKIKTYFEEVKGGRKDSLPGDIVVIVNKDTKHVGIVSKIDKDDGKKKKKTKNEAKLTISASALKNDNNYKVVNNAWGFRRGDDEKGVKFYRLKDKYLKKMVSYYTNSDPVLA